MSDAREVLVQSTAAWTAKVQPEQGSYAEVFRQLFADGYDPETQMTTRAALERLGKRAEQRKVLAGRRQKLHDVRAELMKRLAENDTAIAKELSAAITAANQATSKAVVVEPTTDPDRTLLKSVITSHIKSQRTQIIAAIERDDFSSRAFVDAVRRGATALAP